MINHVESDEVAYRCAFSCEKQGYLIHNLNDKTTEDIENLFTKTEIVKLQKEDGLELDKDYELEGYKIIEDETKAALNVDNYIKSLWEGPELSNHKLKVTDVKLWLSPSDHSNFRYALANTAGPKGVGYKAGRGEKPVHLQFIRNLLIDEYGAQEIKGFEADDALGLYSGHGTILSHIDKDINMIPGWHYDHVNFNSYYNDDSSWFISLNDKKKPICNATMNFYYQLLLGDPTDNIPGISKCGPVGAVKLLQFANSEQEAYDIVREEFIKQYTLEHADRILQECADLLFICRVEGETGSCYLRNKGFI